MGVVLLSAFTGCAGADDAVADGSPSPSNIPLTPGVDNSATDVPSQSPESTPSSLPTTSAPESKATTVPDPSCIGDAVDRLSVDEQVGQLFMGVVQVDQEPAYVPSVLGDAHVGSILLLGNSTGGVEGVAAAVERAVATAGEPGGVVPLVAVDQEGGNVQRLSGPGFSTIPSAEEQASMPDLRGAAGEWGTQLRSAGVDLNLAPVADVVPESVGDANQPIGALNRGYGPDPAVVSEKVTAFARGMSDAGVATAVKHFPGLGKVIGNTDVTTGVVDTSTTRNDPGLAPFRAAAEAGSAFVMVSLATYEKIDPERRAVFSRTVIGGMIRDDMSFDGVVLSDDLGAAAQVSDVPPAQRALRFLRAGGDLQIVADGEALRQMAAAVVDKAESDRQFRDRVTRSVERILTVKHQMGLLDC